jgi:hypothetical protein
MITLFFSTSANAYFFERDNKKKSYNSYYLYPLVANIPGIGKAAGVGVNGANLFNTQADIFAMYLGGDFDVGILSATDIPLFGEEDKINFTMSPVYLVFSGSGLEFYTRGRDSRQDNKYIIGVDKFILYGGEFSLHTHKNQLEIYAGLSSSKVALNSIKDSQDNELSGFLDDTSVATKLYRFGLYIDDTNSRRDPRIGYRVQYERYGAINSDKAIGDGYQDDISITSFTPLFNKSHILVANYFHSSATIVRAGEVDASKYICDYALYPNCDQALLNQIKDSKIRDSKKGNASSLGGTQRLRAYPQGRFYDTYTAFFGVEYRWYLYEGWKPFDNYIWKGTSTGFQLAFFQEFGQVGENDDYTLYQDMKSSTGIGARLLFNTMVVRMDVATGKEGEQLTFFYGYSF